MVNPVLKKVLIIGASATAGLYLLSMVACSNAQPVKADPVQRYAECMADPAQPMHTIFGQPTVAEARAVLDKELALGEQTVEEIKALLPQVCGRG